MLPVGHVVGSRERVRPGSLSTTSRTVVPVHCIVFTVIVPGVVLYSSSPSMHGPDSIHYSFYCVCASSIGGRWWGRGGDSVGKRFFSPFFFSFFFSFVFQFIFSENVLVRVALISVMVSWTMQF